jgi:tetratricopeptide (TPR) repeat protein
MRAFVFTDPALASHARQFVWLDLDTDETTNEPVLRRYEADALPTFLVVDPRSEAVVLRWVGSLTLSQLDAFLEEARSALRGPGSAGSPEEVALARADALYGARKYAEAAVAYEAALAAAPPQWPRYSRAVEALLYCYQSTDAPAPAVALARKARARLAGTPSALTVALGGLDSALALPKDDPGRSAAILEMEADLRAAIADPKVESAADDRSGAYSSLVEACRQTGDEAAARKVAAEWAAFLEAEAAKARSAEERAVFDSHRLSAYLALGEPERALAMLEASERALPRDYNPPNRLARAYASLQRWQEALAASARAEALASGRAKLRVLSLRVTLLQEKGDLQAARRTCDQAIAFGESLPESERPAKAIEQLRKRREALGTPKAKKG